MSKIETVEDEDAVDVLRPILATRSVDIPKASLLALELAFALAQINKLTTFCGSSRGTSIAFALKLSLSVAPASSIPAMRI